MLKHCKYTFFFSFLLAVDRSVGLFLNASLFLIIVIATSIGTICTLHYYPHISWAPVNMCIWSICVEIIKCYSVVVVVVIIIVIACFYPLLLLLFAISFWLIMPHNSLHCMYMHVVFMPDLGMVSIRARSSGITGKCLCTLKRNEATSDWINSNGYDSNNNNSSTTNHREHTHNEHIGTRRKKNY